MTFKFRPHRGSLDDSIALVKEFETWQQLEDIVAAECADYCMTPLELESIKVKPYGVYDSRIGWEEVCIVLASFCGGYKDSPVGFTNGMPGMINNEGQYEKT